ncbi:hypothetical protein [Winogradskyella forsetii]|uniref:hypothetical protein n=1 Tax=Winogradskyella forsetii TaxID=2686077 RepID=UPI0015BCD26C|nr:hypothetical protein [Winogradskyella forsetii]
MNLEEENKEKRKQIPLTKDEWITFFFFPFKNDGGILNTHEINKKEGERFEKYGFKLKKKQADKARKNGAVFYAVIVFLIMIIVNW